MAAHVAMAIVLVSVTVQAENVGALRATDKAAALRAMVQADPAAMTVGAIPAEIPAEIPAAHANGRMMLLNSVPSLLRRFSRTMRSLKFSAAR